MRSWHTLSVKFCANRYKKLKIRTGCDHAPYFVAPVMVKIKPVSVFTGGDGGPRAGGTTHCISGDNGVGPELRCPVWQPLAMWQFAFVELK